jgi:hypothetical protein
MRNVVASQLVSHIRLNSAKLAPWNEPIVAFLRGKGPYCSESMTRAGMEDGKIGSWPMADRPEPCFGIFFTDTLFCPLRAIVTV